MATNYSVADPTEVFGTFNRRFGDTLKDLGWSGPTTQMNWDYYSGGEGGPLEGMEGTVANPKFLEWLKANNLSLQLGQNGNDISGRLYQGDNLLSEQNWQKNNSFDRFVDKAVPAIIGIGTGGILGQALGFLPTTMNPLDPSTWGASSGATSGSGYGITGGATEPVASLGAGAGSGGAANAINPALIDSFAGSAGYGASSAGAGGIGALESAWAAATNPVLNAVNNIGAAVGVPNATGSIKEAITGAIGSGSGSGGSGGIGGLLSGLIGGGSGASDWMKLLLPALTGYAAYKHAKKPQLQGYGGSINAKAPTQTVEQSRYGPVARTRFAAGGIASLPRFLNSADDGMADGIAATIDGQKDAALSGGEFVVPADVVSHLGNGNSQAGAQQLFAMMDRVRQERTGTKQQGREIDPTRMMPR